MFFSFKKTTIYPVRKILSFLKKNISLTLIVFAIVIGVILGLVGKSFDPIAREFITNNIFKIFQTIYIKIIGYVAGPLIFVTITMSIFKMGSFKTFFGRGRRYLLSFIGIMLLVGLVTTLVSLPLFGLSIEQSETATSFSEIGTMLATFLPKSPWDPFIKINLIQIDILAIFAGITLLACDGNAVGVVKILDKTSYFLIKVMRIIAKIVPLYVLFAVIGIFWNNEASTLGTIYLLVILFFVFSIVFSAIFLLIAKIYHKVSLKKLFLCCMDPAIRAFSTANSTIAMPIQYKTAKHLGISKNESSFGVPLAISFFKVPSLIYLALSAVYYYSLTNSSVSIPWIILAVILTTLLTISIAPVSGGGLSNYSMLVNQLSINPIYLGVLIALDPIMDFFITGFNTFAQPVQLLNVASKNKQLNHNILKDKRVILISGAMDVETEWLMSNLTNPEDVTIKDYKCIKGYIGNIETYVLQTDIGMNNAYKSTSEAIKKFEASELISIGTSGGHHVGVTRGDIIVSNKIVNYDNKKDRALVPNKIFASKFLAMQKAKSGVVLTSDTWHKEVSEINDIHNKTNSDVEEMESYMSCKAASENSLNFVALRIVSNNATTKEEYIRECGVDLQKSLFELLRNN